MGVSLQIYRVRIGSFQGLNTLRKKSKIKDNPPYSTWYFFNLIFIIISLSCLSSIFLQPGRSSSQNQSPQQPWIRSSPTTSCCQKPVQLSALLTSKSWLTSEAWNSLCKARNGNRNQRGRGIKVIMWNKGSSLLQNKHQEIETLIEEYTPHILGLCEANLKQVVDINLV